MMEVYVEQVLRVFSDITEIDKNLDAREVFGNEMAAFAPKRKSDIFIVPPGPVLVYTFFEHIMDFFGNVYEKRRC